MTHTLRCAWRSLSETATEFVILSATSPTRAAVVAPRPSVWRLMTIVGLRAVLPAFGAVAIDTRSDGRKMRLYSSVVRALHS
jgi:hypothetical protein